MPNAGVQGMVGRCLELPGHFVGPVTIEHARPLGGGAELRVRLANGAVYHWTRCRLRPELRRERGQAESVDIWTIQEQQI